MPSYVQCRVTGCGKPVTEWSAMCASHRHRGSRYANPTGRPLPNKALDAYRDYVLTGMTRYANRTSTLAALKLADEILRFTPECGFTVEQRIEREMQRLTVGGVTAHELLARVCMFYAYLNDNPARFKSSREEHFALSRAVLSLRPTPNKVRVGTRVLNWLAPMVYERLGMYAGAFLGQMRKEQGERALLLKRTIDFSEMTKDTN